MLHLRRVALQDLIPYALRGNTGDRRHLWRKLPLLTKDLNLQLDQVSFLANPEMYHWFSSYKLPSVVGHSWGSLWRDSVRQRGRGEELACALAVMCNIGHHAQV
jgi:hypothetical protein